MGILRNKINNRVLICGTGSLALALSDEISTRPNCGYRLMGLIAASQADKLRESPYPILGTLDQIQSVIDKAGASRIIVALPESRGLLPVHQLVEAKVGKNMIVENGDEVYEKITGKLAIEALTPSRIIFSEDFRVPESAKIGGRLISLISAVAGLIFLAPLFLIISLAIRLDSRGPVLFVQERVGLEGKRFRLLKFRTMHPTNENHSEWACDNSDRITRVGRVLRRFRLDELPQLINVIRGDMNVVGPRPHPASNYEMFVLVSRNTPICGAPIPYYSLRSLVRPGMTGWAQVKYHYANNLHEEIEKLCFDLYYIKHCSLWLDLVILLETVFVVLAGHKATDNKQAEPAGKLGWDGISERGYPMMVYSDSVESRTEQGPVASQSNN